MADRAYHHGGSVDYGKTGKRVGGSSGGRGDYLSQKGHYPVDVPDVPCKTGDDQRCLQWGKIRNRDLLPSGLPKRKGRKKIGDPSGI